MKSSPKNKRIVCLWFPDWPLQRLLAAKPELARTVLLLTEKTGRGEFVVFCNRWAGRRGISVGMPLAEAHSLVSNRDAVTVEPMLPEADCMALEELAIACDPYSPCVGLEGSASPQSILLDITGIAHLFGGELLLLSRLHKEFAARRFVVRIAIGDSVGMAWAAAHYMASAAKPCILPIGRFESFAETPIEGLRLDQRSIQRLHRLGIRTIGQLYGLDRSSLPSRFGGEIIVRLAQFVGEQPELIVPCRPLPTFEVEQFLDDGLKRSDIIEQWLATLLERLVGLLQKAQRGTRCLQCAFITERKVQHDVAIRLCEATADARHLGDLLRLNMERLRFDAPLVGIRMEALENSRLERPQQELFTGRSQNDARQLPALFNRMSSRLGQQAVVRARLLPDAVPERAFEYVPATNDFSSSTAASGVSLLPFDRPTGVFLQPRPVEVIAVVPNGPPSAFWRNDLRCDIVRALGPERIESGGRQGDAVRRDYYQVETADGRWFWLFRRLQDDRWFLHGGVF